MAVGPDHGVAFDGLALVMRSVPVGIAYAIWSGVGVTLITLISGLVLELPLDLPALIGIGMIVSGVLVLQIFSNASAH